MISAKKLIKLARKWQNFVAIRRKRITLPRTIGTAYTSSCSTSGKAEKGHFLVYSADQKRFLLRLECLENEIIRELFNIAEDEFGLPGNGPLTLPCEAKLRYYAIGLIEQQVTRDVERAFLTSIASSCSSLSSLLQHQVASHHLPICSF